MFRIGMSATVESTIRWNIARTRCQLCDQRKEAKKYVSFHFDLNILSIDFNSKIPFNLLFLSVMRLGKKKEKDRDQEKEQFVDGVARLICSPNSKQSHPIPLRGTRELNQFFCCNSINSFSWFSISVYIDGTEWTGVKFFQLSSQWQTHVKNFPVGLIGAQMTPSDLS